MDRKSFFEQLAAPGVRGLQPYTPGKPIDELEREYGIRDSIKLASNENPMGPPAGALEAARACLKNVALYPDGGGFHLKHALAAHLNLDPAYITLGNGSNDVLVLLAEACLTPDVEAVFDEHAFIIYRLAVQATGAVARVVPSNPADGPQPWGHDLAAFGAALTERTRLVFIANPNNPTGTWVMHEALYEFMERVSEQTIVVIDEAYCEYVARDDYPNTLDWLEEFPNLVITRTFSKIYGLAGLRVGYAISDPVLAELLNRVRQPFNVSSPAQAAATAALADQDFVAQARQLNADGLQALTEGVCALGFDVVPSAGNFVLVDTGKPAGPIYESLLRAGIIVRPVGNYGLPNHLRISVGLPGQNERLLAELKTIRN
jgi:histidinol-phosphate aminotransferase